MNDFPAGRVIRIQNWEKVVILVWMFSLLGASLVLTYAAKIDTLFNIHFFSSINDFLLQFLSARKIL